MIEGLRRPGRLSRKGANDDPVTTSNVVTMVDSKRSLRAVGTVRSGDILYALLSSLLVRLFRLGLEKLPPTLA